MIRNRLTLSAGVLSVLLTAVGLTALQADSSDNVAAAQQKQPKKQTKRKKARGRLPNYFGKVGVSNEQREKIYAIQAKYNAQIKELQKQIADLIFKRDAEIEAVLTPEQKKKLEQLRAEAAKKRKGRKKGSQTKKQKTSG